MKLSTPFTDWGIQGFYKVKSPYKSLYSGGDDKIVGSLLTRRSYRAALKQTYESADCPSISVC